jgi:hypothetical protein
MLETRATVQSEELEREPRPGGATGGLARVSGDTRFWLAIASAVALGAVVRFILR